MIKFDWFVKHSLSSFLYSCLHIFYIFSHYFLSFFSPPTLSCCVLASGTIPWAVLHSPRTGLLILFTLPSILLSYLFFPTLLCLPVVSFKNGLYFLFQMFRYIKPNSTYLHSGLNFCITGGGIFFFFFLCHRQRIKSFKYLNFLRVSSS